MAEAWVLDGEQLEEELVLDSRIEQENVVTNDLIDEILPKFWRYLKRIDTE